MLDIDLVTGPADDPTDIVSLAVMKRHMRISSTVSAYDDDITDMIGAVVDKLEGLNGDLNRSLRPVTWKRWLTRFPDLKHRRHGRTEVKTALAGPIYLPFPPLIEVVAITIEDGSSPDNVVDSTTYVVKTGTLVPEIWPKTTWPDTVEEAQRAVSVTYRAGYAEYPPTLIQLIKILVAHDFENREATIIDNRVRGTQISRQIEFGVDYLRKALLVSNDYDDWGE